MKKKFVINDDVDIENLHFKIKNGKNIDEWEIIKIITDNELLQIFFSLSRKLLVLQSFFSMCANFLVGW